MKNLVPSGKASIIILALAATAACTPKRHGTTAAGKPFDCTIAVPETVDLGLSVCWGTHLVGQSHWPTPHLRLRMGGRRAGRMVGRHLLRLPRPPR